MAEYWPLAVAIAVFCTLGLAVMAAAAFVGKDDGDNGPFDVMRVGNQFVYTAKCPRCGRKWVRKVSRLSHVSKESDCVACQVALEKEVR